MLHRPSLSIHPSKPFLQLSRVLPLLFISLDCLLLPSRKLFFLLLEHLLIELSCLGLQLLLLPLRLPLLLVELLQDALLLHLLVSLPYFLSLPELLVNVHNVNSSNFLSAGRPFPRVGVWVPKDGGGGARRGVLFGGKFGEDQGVWRLSEDWHSEGWRGELSRIWGCLLKTGGGGGVFRKLWVFGKCVF